MTGTVNMPDISVVLVTPDSYDTIRRTVRHLRAQTVRERIEVVIAAPSLKDLRLDRTELEGFFGYRVVEVGELRRPVEAKVAAIRVASAPVVAFGEDHCFPKPEWAEALVAAHGRGWAGVGPACGNANPETMISWAGLFMGFGRWMEPLVAGPSEQVAWHNGSYKRDVLLAYGAGLSRILTVEGFLQADMRRNGHQLYVEPAAKVSHINISRMVPWIRQTYLGGRLFAGMRVQFERWSVANRLLHVAVGPLVPMVRFRRTLRDIQRCGQQRLLPGILGPLIAGLAAHALGEVVGYALGVGDAEQRYAQYEMQRERHVTRRDQTLVTGA